MARDVTRRASPALTAAWRASPPLVSHVKPPPRVSAGRHILYRSRERRTGDAGRAAAAERDRCPPTAAVLLFSVPDPPIYFVWASLASAFHE